MNAHTLNSDHFVEDEIVSIECIGDRPTIDIEVDDTHMFFANDVYSHNSSAQEDVIEAHLVADSYRKIMTGDFIMSLSRKKEDKVTGVARVHIIKNRFGPDGMTYFANFDASNGYIQLYDKESQEGIEIVNKLKSQEDALKKMFRDKWNQSKSTKGQAPDDF